jgi:hypothetical protein
VDALSDCITDSLVRCIE